MEANKKYKADLKAWEYNRAVTKAVLKECKDLESVDTKKLNQLKTMLFYVVSMDRKDKVTEFPTKLEEQIEQFLVSVKPKIKRDTTMTDAQQKATIERNSNSAALARERA